MSVHSDGVAAPDDDRSDGGEGDGLSPETIRVAQEALAGISLFFRGLAEVAEGLSEFLKTIIPDPPVPGPDGPAALTEQDWHELQRESHAADSE